ncbi:LysR family transcriptional regulator [Zooshikella marina]|nr:LysR family transcriptional regulator [Zooshikella ganghwensis]
MTLAAKQLYTTPPAVGSHIKHLRKNYRYLCLSDQVWK